MYLLFPIIVNIVSHLRQKHIESVRIISRERYLNVRKMKHLTKEWRKLPNKELHNLYSLPDKQKGNMSRT
jgi:hypothetical protein